MLNNGLVLLPDNLIKQILDRLNRLGVLMDTAGSSLFILFALYEGRITALDIYDGENREKRVVNLYKDLELKGLIQEVNTNNSRFQLTAIGNELVQWIKEQYKNLSKEDLTSDDLEEFSLLSKDDWLTEFIDLWPTVSPEGYYFKQGTEVIKKKMERFLQVYPYSKELILKAARAYMDDRFTHDYAFTRKVSNFIFYREKAGHTEVSDLAEWCERVQMEKADIQVTSTYDDFLV